MTYSQAVVAVDVKGVPLPDLLIEVVGVELDGDRLRIVHPVPVCASYRRLHDGDEGEQ